MKADYHYLRTAEGFLADGPHDSPVFTLNIENAMTFCIRRAVARAEMVWRSGVEVEIIRIDRKNQLVVVKRWRKTNSREPLFK